MRIKICRKESKESRYWLKLIDTEAKREQEKEREKLGKALEISTPFLIWILSSRQIVHLQHSIQI